MAVVIQALKKTAKQLSSLAGDPQSLPNIPVAFCQLSSQPLQPCETTGREDKMTLRSLETRSPIGLSGLRHQNACG
jgi:hypothetical protein